MTDNDWVNGIGLPPVGEKCRVKRVGGNDFLRHLDGVVVEIIFHDKSPAGSDTAVFRYPDPDEFESREADDDFSWRYHALVSGYFEPTPKKSGERRTTVADILTDMDADPTDSNMAIIHAERLYDAGWRKQ